MPDQHFLGIDLGTTAVKAVLFDRNGGIRGRGHAEYTLETPRPDIVELEPEIYWESVGKAVRDALADNAQVTSLAITGQVETLILLDREGRPLHKAVVWLDNRAKDEARELAAAFDREELFHLSGQTDMVPCWPACKLLWFKKNKPDLFDRIDKALMVEDYIAWKLSGEFATCRGLHPSSLWFDLRTGDYWQPMLEKLGMRREQFPRLCDPGEIMMTTREGNDLLPAGIPVAGAPLDHVCGNLGSGCVAPGMVSVTTGCTLALCAACDHPVYDEERRISTYLGSRPGSFVLLPWAPTAGMLLKHFRNEFAPELSYADFDRLAANIPPGSEGLIILPHSAGSVSPVSNPDARGVAWGVTLAHTKAHWARAILESVAYLLADNIGVLNELIGPATEIRALGGAAASPLWMRIFADTLGLPVTVTDCPEATSLGAAMLAATAVKAYPDLASAAAGMVRVRERFEPGPEAAYYPEYLARYRALNQLILPTFGGK